MGFRSRLAQAVYDFLDVGKSPRPADCIFVPAGTQEPKDYGVKMWHFGYAPQLVLGESEQRAGRRKTYALVRMDLQETARAQFKGRSEARALAEFIRGTPVRSMLILSPPARIRRTAVSFRRAFRKSAIQFTFVAVPEKRTLDSPAARAEVWAEFRRFLRSRLSPF